MTDDPLFYSDASQPNPLIRIDEGFCETFYHIRAAIVADSMSLQASSDHVKSCERCHNYLSFLKSIPPLEIPIETF